MRNPKALWAICPGIKSHGLFNLHTGKLEPGTQIAIAELDTWEFIGMAQRDVAEQIVTEHNSLLEGK